MTAAFVTASMIAMAIGVFSDATPKVCPLHESSTMSFPHECFCDEYYECSRGERIHRYCPAGDLFDQASGSCVPSDTADFSHCEGWVPHKRNCPPYGETTVPHETDCISYYRCKDGQKTLRRCKGGLHYNEVKGLCTWGNSQRCDRKIGYTHQISGRSSLNPKAVDLVCPPAGSNTTVRLPHPCRCDLYYECIDGNAIYKQCQEGLEFDYVRGVCDDPSNFQCIRPIPSTTTSTSTTSTTQAPTTTSTTQAPTTTSTTPAPTTTSTTPAPTTTSTTPAPTTTSTTQAPTTTSTTQAPTTTSTTQAPTTTLTTPAPTTTSTTQAPTTTSTTQAPTTTSTTQAPTTTSTTPAPTTTSTTPAPTTTSTTQAPTTTSTTQAPTTTSTTPAPLIPGCPRNCPQTVRLPNPTDCSSYYECRSGTRTLLRCPTGLRFHRSTQMCDWPWAVIC